MHASLICLQLCMANAGARGSRDGESHKHSGHQAPAAARHAEDGWAAGEATGLFYLYYQPLVPVAAMAWAWAGLVALFEARAVQYGVCFSSRDQQLLPPARALYHVIALSSFRHVSCALIPRACRQRECMPCTGLRVGRGISSAMEQGESALQWSRGTQLCNGDGGISSAMERGVAALQWSRPSRCPCGAAGGDGVGGGGDQRCRVRVAVLARAAGPGGVAALRHLPGAARCAAGAAGLCVQGAS